MAKISLERAKSKGTLSTYNQLESNLRSLYRQVENVRKELRSQISGREAIAARLREAIEQINQEADGIWAMKNGLEQIIAKYEQTENANRERVVAKKISVHLENGIQTIENLQDESKHNNPDDQFLSLIKSLLSWLDKTDSSDKAGITKDGLSYIESLYKFITGDKKGLTGADDLCDLLDKSVGLWTGLYGYLKDFYNEIGDVFSISNQKKVAGVGLAGGVFSFISSALGVVDTINNSENIGPAGIIGEILGGGGSIVDIWSDIEKLKHIGDITPNITKGNGLYSPLTYYSTIAKSYISAFSQGFKSFEKYIADGTWDLGDSGKTGIEFGVTGLYSMFDSLSFGLISEKTISISADDISQSIENWAENVGTRAGKYIQNNSALYDTYNKSGPIGRTAITFFAASKSWR